MQVESELTELPSEERTEFLESLGVGESGLGNLIRATYSVLGLRTYFTSGEKVKKWSVSNLLNWDVFILFVLKRLSDVCTQETKAWTILAGELWLC